MCIIIIIIIILITAIYNTIKNNFITNDVNNDCKRCEASKMKCFLIVYFLISNFYYIFDTYTCTHVVYQV